MIKSYSKFFIRLNWASLIFIYLVVIAGSFVRITGSGMGCPDWPKCFGSWIPPTNDKSLPSNYKDIYAEKREAKIIKFANFIEKLGFKKESEQLRTNKSLLIEQDFNARKTWTEYINRLFGAVCGFLILFIFVLTWFKYKKLKRLSTINLVLLLIQAWFGSIVVATNLVPWTITVHMFLALLIIALQIQLIIKIRKEDAKKRLELSPKIKVILWLVLIITFIQMFLGTQVREYIDELTKAGFLRSEWTEKLGLSFFIHRSFSWLVLLLLTFVVYLNWKKEQNNSIYLVYSVLIIELISGILLAYANMPGLVQTAHLLFACVMFGMLYYLCFQPNSKASLS